MFRLTLSITFAMSTGLAGSLALAAASSMDTTQLFTFQGDTASAIAAPEANATDWQLRTVISSDRLPVAFDHSGQRLLTLSPRHAKK